MPLHLKSDRLAVRCYACHGDMCGSDAVFHDQLGCASGHKSRDLVLVAQFAYLQEAIDYCRDGARRGVRMCLVSRIASERRPHVSHYWPDAVSKEQTFRPQPDTYLIARNGDSRMASSLV